MTQLWLLYRLQQIDSKIRVSEHGLTQLVPSDDLARKISVRQRKLKEMDEALHKLRTQLKDAELKLASITSHRTEIEAKLYSGKVTNPKELSGFQMESDQLKHQAGEVEDKALELMEQIDGQTAEMDKLKKHLEHAVKQQEDEGKSQAATRVQIEAEIAENNRKRAALVAELETPLITRYEGLRKRKDGVAVTKMQGTACGTCGVTVPEPVRRRVLERELETCPSCERILFSEEATARHHA
ncbi:MAG: hypothetical protein FJX76_20655 [Armatimonadetes bacterium]|nr:hypothetical protein [Armatimonadota bacterium]